MREQEHATALPRRALLGAVAGLLAPVPARARRPAALQIAVILPGGDGRASMLARQGAEIAAELLSRRDRSVSLRFIEASGGAEQVTRATMRLVDEGAGLLLAACGDATTEAALAVAERREVPLVAATAIAPALGDRGSRLLIRTGPTASQLVGRGLGLLRDLYASASLPLPQRIACVHADTAEGQLVRETLGAILPISSLPLARYDGLGVTAEGGSIGQREPEAVLNALRAASPDLVLLAAPAAAAARILKAIAKGNLNVAGIASFGLSGLAAPEILALPDRAGECHVTFAPWPDPRAAVTAEVRSLFDRHGGPMPFALAQGALALVVDAVLLAGEAAARHPAARGHALAGALRGSILVQKMMRGPPMRFDARGQNTAMPSVALQNQGGRPVVVLPREGAEAKPVWPNPDLENS
jgi:branched-chain amino acid transport system substrate-binding protein